MSDEQKPAGENGESNDEDTTEDTQDRSRRDAIEDRFKQGLGMLGAMRDAIEDTIRDIKERGDLAPERAKEVVRGALDKAQQKAEEAREALDFVKQKEFDGLKSVVDDLASRLGIVEEKAGIDQDETEEEGS